MDEIIENNRIVSAILKKIESDYRNDVAIFVCYGSFITNTENRLSDIDFYVIPKTKTGYEITQTFIIDNIGYDLWLISWERIEGISNLTSPFASILLDARVMFYSDETDLLRFEKYRKNTRSILDDEERIRKLFDQKLLKLQSDIFELMFSTDRNDRNPTVVRILEDYLTMLALLNGTYVKKGLYNLESEIVDYAFVPSRFRERIERALKSNGRRAVAKVIANLLRDLKEIRSPKPENRDGFDPNELLGFFEEFKSIYNKLISACDAEDFLKAVYSAQIVDSEIRAVIPEMHILKRFPGMVKIARTGNYVRTKNACFEHEEVLRRLYAE